MRPETHSQKSCTGFASCAPWSYRADACSFWRNSCRAWTMKRLARGSTRQSARIIGKVRFVTRVLMNASSPSSPADRHEAYPRVGAPQPANRPDWFRVPATGAMRPGSRFLQLQESLRSRKLATVCEEAQCPNIGECWNGEHATATIMLLGDTCTRGCRFCAVKTAAQPPAPDPDEPLNVAAEVASWDIDYVVLTSVDRDDLPDGGAAHFARTVQYLKQLRPTPAAADAQEQRYLTPATPEAGQAALRPLFVECLVSDFAGNAEAVQCLAVSGLDVYAHNLETVERLQRHVRDPRASYEQSLRVLRLAKQSNDQLVTKTSLMLGLGETSAEVIQTMRHLREIQVDVVTFGQYLRPSKHHLSVVDWIHPDQFTEYRRIGEEMGFLYVAAGPLVRSSYRAGEYMMTRLLQQRKQIA